MLWSEKKIISDTVILMHYIKPWVHRACVFALIRKGCLLQDCLHKERLQDTCCTVAYLYACLTWIDRTEDFVIQVKCVVHE